MSLLSTGDVAPDIRARGADGKEVTLSSLRGRYVLVYFYPKDDTPGCTAEACSLNDMLPDLSGCGADVIGVSSQDDDSHDRFRAKFGLRFALAADTDRAIADAYGVGRMLGILPVSARQSFLVGPDGRIAKVWPHVNASQHAAEVLDAVRELGTPAVALAGQPKTPRPRSRRSA